MHGNTVCESVNVSICGIIKQWVGLVFTNYRRCGFIAGTVSFDIAVLKCFMRVHLWVAPWTPYLFRSDVPICRVLRQKLSHSQRLSASDYHFV